MNGYIDGLVNVPHDARGGVLTIGNFDGVHLGHQRIVAAARAIAEMEGRKVVVMTFEPPPELVLRPRSTPQRVLPPEQKVSCLLEAGADYAVAMNTDEALLAMAPEEFVDKIIVQTFAPRHMVEGPNFFFGLARSGDVNTLRLAGDRHAFTVKVVEPVRMRLSGDIQRVSSTLIRRLVQEGAVEDAAACLGREFTLYGSVVPGAGHGRVLEFPTANLKPGSQVLPGDGVYAGRGEIGGRTYPAAISVGTKPTFGCEDRTVEAFLLGADGDFYGQELALVFRCWLRGQKQFRNVAQLQGQMVKDVQRVREICGSDV